MFYYKYKSVLSVLSVFETKKNSVLMSPYNIFSKCYKDTQVEGRLSGEF